MNKLYVVGIGPGAYEEMTLKAVSTLEQCDLIVGYTVYVSLIKNYFPQKEFLATPMMKEVERCHLALQESQNGKNVAMICSGDPGVYGMASLLYELSPNYPCVKIDVISGVSAALSGGAVLGAPLTHDFAVISLSDLLTSWETIELRLRNCARSDMAISIYNPASVKRADYLNKACQILLEEISENTICGVVRNIGRVNSSHEILKLKELQTYPADMFCTIFIGNSSTKMIQNKMVTLRGYQHV